MARPGSPAFREPGRGHADQREAHSGFYPVGLLLFLITTEVLWFIALKQFVEQIFKICETQWQIPHGHSRPEPLGFSRAGPVLLMWGGCGLSHTAPKAAQPAYKL